MCIGRYVNFSYFPSFSVSVSRSCTETYFRKRIIVDLEIRVLLCILGICRCMINESKERIQIRLHIACSAWCSGSVRSRMVGWLLVLRFSLKWDICGSSAVGWSWPVCACMWWYLGTVVVVIRLPVSHIQIKRSLALLPSMLVLIIIDFPSDLIPFT